MADIMYQRSEGDIAMKHFSQLLERNPSMCQDFSEKILVSRSVSFNGTVY